MFIKIRIQSSCFFNCFIETIRYNGVSRRRWPIPAFSIGVDLGGTNLRVAAIEETGAQLEVVSALSEVSRGRETIIAELAQTVSALIPNSRVEARGPEDAAPAVTGKGGRPFTAEWWQASAVEGTIS